MMKFNSDHKVVTSSLSTAEVAVFIDFLKFEVLRHRVEVWFYSFAVHVCSYPMSRFLLSARMRHEVDIKETKRLIEELKVKQEPSSALQR